MSSVPTDQDVPAPTQPEGQPPSTTGSPRPPYTPGGPRPRNPPYNVPACGANERWDPRLRRCVPKDFEGPLPGPRPNPPNCGIAQRWDPVRRRCVPLYPGPRPGPYPRPRPGYPPYPYRPPYRPPFRYPQGYRPRYPYPYRYMWPWGYIYNPYTNRRYRPNRYRFPAFREDYIIRGWTSPLRIHAIYNAIYKELIRQVGPGYRSMFSSANNDRIRQLAWQKAQEISEMARAMAQSGRGYALNRYWLEGKVEAAAHDIRSELNLGVIVANASWN